MSRWFEVRAVVRVRAADSSDAVGRVAGVLAKDGGVYPVGRFGASQVGELGPVSRISSMQIRGGAWHDYH